YAPRHPGGLPGVARVAFAGTGLERARAERPAFAQRAREHALAHAVTHFVGVRFAREETFPGLVAIPHHTVSLAHQVVADLVCEDLDRVRVGKLVLQDVDVASDDVARQAEPARVEPNDVDAAADRAVLVVAEHPEGERGRRVFAGRAATATRLLHVPSDRRVV